MSLKPDIDPSADNLHEIMVLIHEKRRRWAWHMGWKSPPPKPAARRGAYPEG